MINTRKNNQIALCLTMLFCYWRKKITMIRSKVVEQYLTIFTHKHMRKEKKIKKLILLIDGSSLYLEREREKRAEEILFEYLLSMFHVCKAGSWKPFSREDEINAKILLNVDKEKERFVPSISSCSFIYTTIDIIHIAIVAKIYIIYQT